MYKPLKLTTFINLRTDYGFKIVFGTEKNKHILIRFLNALLGPDLKVENVEYHNKEILPATEDGKRIIYDVYCTSDVEVPDGLYLHMDCDLEYDLKPSQKGEGASDKPNKLVHHFILEMQNVYEIPFEDRALFYTAKAITEQGMHGWTYALNPVISIIVTDFNMHHLSEALVHDMVVSDRQTHEVLSEKMRIIFLSLKQMKDKEWEDCEGELEELLYILKHSDKMDKNHKAYTCGRYKDLFDAAETNSMASEDVVAYGQSLQRMIDAQRNIDIMSLSAREKGRAEGRAEGHAEGRAEGLTEGAYRKAKIIAMNLIKMGLGDQTVAEATGLVPTEVAALRVSL